MTEKTNQEDEFYFELDKKTTRKSCCTCQTLAIFFVVFLIVVVLATVYLFRLARQTNISPQKLYPSNVARENFFKKIESTSQNPTISITVTSEELTAASNGGISSASVSIQALQFAINPEQIVVSGRLTKPFGSNIKIYALPIVEEGKVLWQIQKTMVGILPLPGVLNKKIETGLNQLLDGNFQTLYDNYQVEKIELQKDAMIISGKLKT